MGDFFRVPPYLVGGGADVPDLGRPKLSSALILGRDHCDVRHSSCGQVLDRTFQYGCAEHVCVRRGHRAGLVNDEKRAYAHGTHRGAAVRNNMERDGTHDGIRRKRDIGRKACVRWCRLKERRYLRMICGMV